MEFSGTMESSTWAAMLPFEGLKAVVDVTKKASAEYTKRRSSKGVMIKMVVARCGNDFCWVLAFHTYTAMPVCRI
jgi:hypothetical protein